MLSALSILLIGFVLGMRHATDPDHVVAVTTIVSSQPSLRRASRVGAMWGIGHSITILLVGGVLVVFRLAIPARLGLAMEFAVAVMLIVLGVANLSGAGAPVDRGGRMSSRPLVVGFIHGLAGSAFVALLVLAAVPSALLGLVYLALFGLGTVGGMMLITVAIAAPSALTARRFGNAQRYLRLASGVASVAFGLFLARQGIVDGLFSAAPDWTPR
jgi:high-affinity nickel-transport protein